METTVLIVSEGDICVHWIVSYVEMFRKTEILVLVLTALTGFLSNSVLAKRGPHHPRSEPLGKVNEHIVHSDEWVLWSRLSFPLVPNCNSTNFRHLKADLKASHLQPGKPVEEMTVEEKHFYHFKMHDYDNNNLLDGLELLQSTNAHHDESFHSHHTATGVTADHGAADKKQLSTDNEEEQGLQHLVGKRRMKEEMISHFISFKCNRRSGAVNQLICDIWQINFFSGFQSIGITNYLLPLLLLQTSSMIFYWSPIKITMDSWTLTNTKKLCVTRMTNKAPETTPLRLLITMWLVVVVVVWMTINYSLLIRVVFCGTGCSLDE